MNEIPYDIPSVLSVQFVHQSLDADKYYTLISYTHTCKSYVWVMAWVQVQQLEARRLNQFPNNAFQSLPKVLYPLWPYSHNWVFIHSFGGMIVSQYAILTLPHSPKTAQTLSTLTLLKTWRYLHLLFSFCFFRFVTPLLFPSLSSPLVP